MESNGVPLVKLSTVNVGSISDSHERMVMAMLEKLEEQDKAKEA
jgi:hypothetical protein